MRFCSCRRFGLKTTASCRTRKSDSPSPCLQKSLRRVLAAKAGLRAAHTKVLYGGFMGCGWRRWSDEVGLERLTATVQAWEEWDTVYALA